MSEKNRKTVFVWLLIVCGLIMLMVTFGGYVRLTRSGLSIVEWNPVSGVVPPIGEEAWQEEFAKYQQSPEFQLINSNMSLAEYKKIFYVEFIHRLIGRIAGLIVAIPLLYFLVRRMLPPGRKLILYISIGLLFGFQGWLGWYMVSSGLVDKPAVSHFRLTFHLLTALLLLGLAAWAALNHYYRFPDLVRPALKSTPFKLSLTLMVSLLIQIAYGGFMAGLKAGYVSNTYPLMFDRWIPGGLFTSLEPWWMNLISAAPTVHFIHRWFAMVVLIASAWLYYTTRKQEHAADLHKGIKIMVWLTIAQITLGVLTIWFNVHIFWALTHQFLALFLFLTTIFINYRVVHGAKTEKG